jgi:polyhydroxyalkanoate synthesis regulator phasin
MDKKLLADFSRIIRDIESKNLYKEADILNNCLVRLAQMAEDAKPTEQQISEMNNVGSDLETNIPTPGNELAESAYSNQFLTELLDFTIKGETVTKKLKDFVARGEMPSEDFKANVDQLLTQSNKILSMNEAQGEEKNKLNSMVESLNFLKNIF